MEKTLPEIIHEINDHIQSLSAALAELEKTLENESTTTVAELASKLHPLNLC